MENKARILIADDAVDVVELLRKRLRHEGYETIEAYDGEECLARARECTPDLIILDIMMPKLDGYEVCRQLRSHRKTAYIPVLMLTAKGEVESKVRGLDAGAQDYVAKPFNYAELSARIKALLAAQAAREKLVQEEKLDALDQMMEGVVHELRNPLTSIGGFARRILDNLPEGDPNRRYARIILDEVSRLEKMIKHLVELKTAAIAYKEPEDVNAVIEEVRDRFRRWCDAENVQVETNLAQDLPLVSLDRENMKLALAHIVENSLEAMQGMDRKVLRLSTRVDDGRVEISIADSGKGIPKDKIKYLFDPFFTSKTSGPGLGLTLALRIIQEHRGTLSVESEPGSGTVFTVRLPVSRTACPPP